MMLVTKEADMSLKRRKAARPPEATPEPTESELPERWRAKIGELMMRLRLAELLIEKRELADEWKRSRR
jgi:hypothetical protein